jgi:hypothetical protein
MIRAISGAALLLAVAAPAWAQSQEEIDKALMVEMQAYTDCIKAQAVDLSRSTETPDAIADRAIGACQDRRHDLWAKMQEPPLNASPGDATAAIQQTNDGLKPMVLETVRKARGA